MKSRKIRRATAAALALSLTAGLAAPSSASVMENDFNDGAYYPWQSVQSYPAKQNIITKDGAVTITVINENGADSQRWDLKFRHRNLNFRIGHKYRVSFKARASRENIELYTVIQDLKGAENYLNSSGDELISGPSCGGQWGTPLSLTTEWTEYSGEFTALSDIENSEWVFEYANGQSYGGNTKAGDRIQLDDIVIECLTCPSNITCNDPSCAPGAKNITSRSGSETWDNFISVNQMGYYTESSKIAVLGDNSGDPSRGRQTSEITGGMEFELIDTESGKAVFTGKSSPVRTDADSGDIISRLDFTEFKTPGTYYLRAGKMRSENFRIGDDIYSENNHSLLTDALNFFYQNRSGLDIEDRYITSGDKSKLAHEGLLKGDNAVVQTERNYGRITESEGKTKYASSVINAAGGWMETGSHKKCVVNGGISLWTLQNMYERAAAEGNDKFDDDSGTVVIPETGNKIPDILDEALYELEWMSSMVVKEDEPTWGEMAGLVYHSVQDCEPSYLGESYLDYDCDGTVRTVSAPSFAATLNYAACAAQAARLLEPYNRTMAEFYLSQAKESYQAYLLNYYEPDLTVTMHPDGYPVIAETLNKKSLFADSSQDYFTNNWGDMNVKDEAYWAACEIFVSASLMNDSDAEKYHTELASYTDAFKTFAETKNSLESTAEKYAESYTAFSNTSTAAAGNMTLALHSDLLTKTEADKLKKYITETADEYLKTSESQGYGLPYRACENNIYDTGSLEPDTGSEIYDLKSNSMVLNNAVIMAYAYSLDSDEKYLDGVTSAMNYLLGTNPMGISYVTGYGSYSVQNPTHSYWAGELSAIFPYAPDGVMVSGPASKPQDELSKSIGLTQDGIPPQRSHTDGIEAYETNSSGLDINASLVWVASFLNDAYSFEAPPVQPSCPSVEDTDQPSASPSPEAPAETPSSLPSAAETPAAETVMTGDINGDGKIDITDLSVLAVKLVEKMEFTESETKAADVNRDGVVSLADLATIRQFVSKIISKF